MDNYFQNKVVWITGASSGIGEALTYALSASGARLILSSRRIDELKKVQQACQNPPGVRLLPLDLADPTTLGSRVTEAWSQFGGIDIMIHNGGISIRSLVKDTSVEQHRRLMEVDYFSYVILTQALLPHFISQKSGHFVVVSSVMGKIGTPMRSSYAAAKHALHGYFDCLRAEVARDGIKVTIVTPGYVRTNIVKHAVVNNPGQAGKASKDIANGLPADRAALQILRAIERHDPEAYIGKFSGERIALWLNRFLPKTLIKIAPKLTPK